MRKHIAEQFELPGAGEVFNLAMEQLPQVEPTPARPAVDEGAAGQFEMFPRQRPADEVGFNWGGAS